MKEPNVEAVDLCTVPVARTEVLAALKLPEGARILVNGAPVDGVVVEWLQKKELPAVPVTDGYVPPHRRVHICETCNRTVKGSGPFASHLKFHRVNGHRRRRKTVK